MPPQTSSVGSLDPQAVALAKAIRQSESGGNFNASGKSGEHGAYQYTDNTWAKDSASAGVHVPLQQATPEQQNEVAYNRIKGWKDAGYNPGQIASMWNAGAGEPDAYKGTFSNGKPSVGVNGYGVKYDVPSYAKSVASAYQTLKGGGQVNADPNNPSSTANTNPVQPPQPKKDFLDTASDIVGSIFPGKQIGNAVGTALVTGNEYLRGQPQIAQNIAKTAPTPLKVGGDAAQAALMLATPGVGVGETALGRIGGTAALGAAGGVTNALANGSTDVGDITKQGLIGGAAGGLLGGAGELTSKAAQWLPYSITRKFLPGVNSETAQYAVKKGLGSVGSMAKSSEANLTKVGGDIEKVLNAPELSGVVATAPDVYSPIISKYPNAGLTPEIVADELKKLAPLQKGLVDKLGTEGLNAAELNQLKSAIGNATYKTVFDDPSVKAGKEMGNTAYAAISDWLKTKVPGSAPLFDEYSKELQLSGALAKAIRAGEKAKFIGLPELLSMMGGFSMFGPVGGAGALLLEKGARNPSVNLMAGGLLNKLAQPGAAVAGKMGLLEAQRQLNPSPGR